MRTKLCPSLKKQKEFHLNMLNRPRDRNRDRNLNRDNRRRSISFSVVVVVVAGGWLHMYTDLHMRRAVPAARLPCYLSFPRCKTPRFGQVR